MGEYLTTKDPENPRGYRTVAKIGTCDHMMYARRDELLPWRSLDAGEGTDVGAILGDVRTLYRFPWPDEDHDGEPGPFSGFDGRDAFRTLTISLDDETPRRGTDIQHRPVTVCLNWRGGGGQVNVSVPCPASKDSDLISRSAPAVQIIGERYDADGQPRTIFACAYCEAPFSADVADLARFRACLEDLAKSRDHQERLSRDHHERNEGKAINWTPMPGVYLRAVASRLLAHPAAEVAAARAGAEVRA